MQAFISCEKKKMEIQTIKTGLFKEGEDLFRFIIKNVRKLPEKSILVVTSKIVALSEGRVRTIRNDRDKDRIFVSESEWALKTKHAWLTIKNGAGFPSAGVDESIANGKLILLRSEEHTSEL